MNASDDDDGDDEDEDDEDDGDDENVFFCVNLCWQLSDPGFV